MIKSELDYALIVVIILLLVFLLLDLNWIVIVTTIIIGFGLAINKVCELRKENKYRNRK